LKSLFVAVVVCFFSFLELRYMQQMSSLGHKTSRTLNEMAGDQRPLPLLKVFLNSVESVRVLSVVAMVT
jgi:hypothetical protein